MHGSHRWPAPPPVPMAKKGRGVGNPQSKPKDGGKAGGAAVKPKPKSRRARRIVEAREPKLVRFWLMPNACKICSKVPRTHFNAIDHLLGRPRGHAELVCKQVLPAAAAYALGGAPIMSVCHVRCRWRTPKRRCCCMEGAPARSSRTCWPTSGSSRGCAAALQSDAWQSCSTDLRACIRRLTALCCGCASWRR